MQKRRSKGGGGWRWRWRWRDALPYEVLLKKGREGESSSSAAAVLPAAAPNTHQ